MNAPAVGMRRQSVGVAVAGMGWMGQLHTRAYARVLHHYPQLPVTPELVVVADEAPGRAQEAVEQFGFATATQDWREVAADPRVNAGEYLRAELSAPRDRCRNGPRREAHLD